MAAAQMDQPAGRKAEPAVLLSFPTSDPKTKLRFLAIFGGMTVVHLGGQTDLLGAGTFWLVNVAARWFLR